LPTTPESASQDRRSGRRKTPITFKDGPSFAFNSEAGTSCFRVHARKAAAALLLMAKTTSNPNVAAELLDAAADRIRLAKHILNRPILASFLRKQG
jgi:hypothetical protein